MRVLAMKLCAHFNEVNVNILKPHETKDSLPLNDTHSTAHTQSMSVRALIQHTKNEQSQILSIFSLDIFSFFSQPHSPPIYIQVRCSYQHIAFCVMHEYYDLWLWHAVFIFVYSGKIPQRSALFNSIRQVQILYAESTFDRSNKRASTSRNRHWNSKINGFYILPIESLFVSHSCRQWKTIRKLSM